MKINYQSITLTEAISMITCHRVEILKGLKVPVFIFIDEFRQLAQKCASPPEVETLENDVLSFIGLALRSADHLTVLISTLDHTPLLRAGA